MGGDDRGQTLYDFALGISLFLVTFMVALSLIPGIFTPFQAPIRSEQTVQAERVSEGILDSLTDERGSRRLNSTATDDFFADTDADDLRATHGFGPEVRLNVTLQVDAPRGCDAAGADCRSVGDGYDGRPVATSLRVVAGYDGGTGECAPTCRIIVRVW
jgi:hypothetical protein